MNFKSERVLGTLQVLLEGPHLCFHLPNNETSTLEPFFWDGEKQGAFSVLQLAKAQGWATLTDPEIAFKQWQETAEVGHLNRDDYPESYDGLLAAPDVHQQNAGVYLRAQTFLQKDADEIQTWTLSCMPMYKTAIVLAKEPAGKWLGLTCTTPPQTLVREEVLRSTVEQADEKMSAIAQELETIINQLTPLPVYGFYGGGYDCHFDYRLVQSTGQTPACAFERTLTQAGMLEVSDFEGFNPDASADYWSDEPEKFESAALRCEKINAFLRKELSNLKFIRLSFWNRTYLYVLGETQGSDLVGITVKSDFDYNP